jgi:hypothetical protein
MGESFETEVRNMDVIETGMEIGRSGTDGYRVLRRVERDV